MTIKDVIEKFSTPPFLFVGSGLSRRYLGLPDWNGLLKHFAEIISDDEYAYSAYENKAKTLPHPHGLLPKVAELIEEDYNDLWFRTPSLRTVSQELGEAIKNMQVSPFKAEVASYIASFDSEIKEYEEEIQKLAKVSEHNVAGVITTNYDAFIESHFDGFTKYIGQNELIFSATQGIAEIYKIHGSIEKPDSLVINESDYSDFQDKSAYLAAKLLTIFMEYPLVFIGYSISDSNVQSILESMVYCLSESQLEKLQQRFVFVEYVPDQRAPDVTPYTIMIHGKPLNLTRIKTSEFMGLFEAFESVRTKLPVKILRKFKDELYSYVITSTPTSTMRVAELNDKRVADDDLVLAIGRSYELGLKGLSGIDSNEWYSNILLNNIDFTADELLTYAFPSLIRTNSGRLPLHKYLSEAKQAHPECEEKALSFDDIISNTIKRDRKQVAGYNSIADFIESEQNENRRLRLLSYFTEDQYDLEVLERFLHSYLDEDVDFLNHTKQNQRSDFRRLILIYDYLKWGKEKEPET